MGSIRKFKHPRLLLISGFLPIIKTLSGFDGLISLRFLIRLKYQTMSVFNEE